MKRFLLSLLLFLPLIACSDDDEPTPGVVLQHSVQVVLTDEEGNDLLDMRNEGSYDPEEIRIYKVINGEEELYVDGSMDAPYGVIFANKQEWVGMEGTPDVSYVDLLVMLPETIVDNRTTVVVKWNETESDTFVCEIDPEWNNNIRKVYVNGELKWDEHTLSPIYNDYGSPAISLVK